MPATVRAFLFLSVRIFKNFEFIGAYDIGPRTMDGVVFEDCSFSGVLSFGITNNVRFLRCSWSGKPVMFAEKGSKNGVFEDCRFNSSSNEPNSWGAVGRYGESEFLRCKARWFNLRGHAKLIIDSCEFDNVDCATDPRNSGISAVVSITSSKLRGTFNLAASNLQSLTIRDTVLDNLEMTNAAVEGDVLMDPKLNQSFTIVDSRMGRVDASYLNSTRVRLERNIFDSLDLSNSRITKLELTGNTVARSVDFRQTHVEESKLQRFAKGQAKLEGSNIKAD